MSEKTGFDALAEMAEGSLMAGMFNPCGKCETLKQEAQIHAQEARTANATIAEIYQLCTGSTGEPGNWNGAEPVRELLDSLAAQVAQLTAEIAEYEGIEGRCAKGHNKKFTYSLDGRDGCVVCNADRVAAERDRYKAERDELIMAVVSKHPDETRFQTALRYITEAEKPKGGSQMQMLPTVTRPPIILED